MSRGVVSIVAGKQMGSFQVRNRPKVRDDVHSATFSEALRPAPLVNAPYWIFVTLHVLSAVLWLGGMFFLAAVGAPVLRRLDDPALRQALFSSLGRQFRTVGWWTIAVLVASGTGILYLRGVLRWERLGDPGFWSTPYGEALAWKLTLVGVILAFQAFHDFFHGPRASTLEPGSARAVRLRRTAAWLGRVNVLLGVALVYVAVRLARGGM